jgi:beta-aspartyl-peptidase (threonine type)
MSKDKEYAPLLTRPVDASSNYVLVIHGGAGTMTRKGSSPEQRVAYHRVLKQALRAGYAVLSEGGEAMDAAVAAVTVMEGARPCHFVVYP